MGLTVDDSGGTHVDPVQQGIHVAWCCAIYDLGTHYNEKFDKTSRRVLIMWEIPSERIEIERDGKMVNLPRVVSKRYTQSLHEKSNLRKDLESWRGKEFTADELRGFDLKNVLGAACQLQVIHKKSGDGKKIYAYVSNILPLGKGQERPAGESDQRFFSFEDGDEEIPENTPDWIAEIIKESDEWKAKSESDMVDASTIPPEGDDDFDDQIPF